MSIGASLSSATPASHPGQDARPENEVKAAFLYNFARFVEWPRETGDADREILRIAVLGDDALATAVKELVDGKSIDGTRVVVERVYAGQALGRCDILYVAASEDPRLEEIFEAVGDRPVLTVGETNRFARLGGMIRFRIVDTRLRFEVNLNAAREPGLAVSSRLLGVASAVTGAPGGAEPR